MKKFVLLSMVLMALPLYAQAATEIAWTSTRVKTADDMAAAQVIRSDAGGYQFEALEPEAEKTRAADPIPVARMKGHRPMIAVLIDDMGLDRQHDARVTALPAAVSLSYLPYAPGVKAQVKAAQEKGHEIVLHLPMQPERKTADPGPDYLGTAMSPLVLLERLQKNLAAFDGYVAGNNHMGSKFTQNRDGLNVVMGALAEKGIPFLDSLTAPGSVAEEVARAHGLAATHRDVFIDNDTRLASVMHSLAETEAVAKRSGAAIAIGHPKEETLAGLEKWLPTLAAKGFDIVPLSKVMMMRNMPPAKVASAAPAIKPVIKDETVMPLSVEEAAAHPLPEIDVTAPVMPPEESSVATAIDAAPADPAMKPHVVKIPTPVLPIPVRLYEERTSGRQARAEAKTVQKREEKIVYSADGR
jgi:polysaccharide deacetylase 2 family uncharacterized protein YibQ